jgi:hypothetical protein
MKLIAPPKIVQNAIDEVLAPLFKNAPQRKHAAHYLTGLMISENKTVTGITDQTASASDQSCLNRFLTEADWNAHELNDKRIELMQQSDDTKFHPRGVIAIDDVLIEKTGKQIPDSGTFWDHSEQRYKHGQDLIIAHYVHPTSGKHYPLDFKRFKKADQCEWTGEQFKKMTELTIELIDWCQEHDVQGYFTFDSFYTCAEIQNHIHSLPMTHEKTGEVESRGYVGDLKFNRLVEFKGQKQQAVEFAHGIPGEDRKPVTVDGKKQWYLSVCVKMPKVSHKVRVVILWKYKNDAEPRKILVTNKIHWNAERIIETYRMRWTGTETFHRDGKQDLGLGDCQLRDSEGQTRHTYLVFLAYSLLVRELDKTGVSEWACVKLTTIGDCCRSLFRESVRSMIEWVVEQMENVQKMRGGAAKRMQFIFHRLGLDPIAQR